MSRQAVINEATRHLGGPLPARVVCPVCNGGSDHEECLTIWDGDDGNVYATCHRSKCSITTVLVSGSLNIPAIAASQFRDKPEHLTSPTQYRQGRPATDNTMRWVRNKVGYDFPDRYFGPYVQSYGHGLDECAYFPMLDVDTNQRGCILKPIHSKSELPKSLTYKDQDYVGLSWFLPADHLIRRGVVLVEDVLSALAILKHGGCALSLNGTMLNPERIDLISRYKSCIHICLDADASLKAVKYALRYRNRYTIKVTRLERDLKDMTDPELEVFTKALDL